MANSIPGTRITADEARAALLDPERGSLRVLKALGKKMDEYNSALAKGITTLKVFNEFDEIAARAVIDGYKKDLEDEGIVTPDIRIEKPGFMGAKMTSSTDTNSITRQEALDALKDPEKGSLRVLKALGKQRDIYARQLMGGQKRLVVHNAFEEVCAEAAIKDFEAELESEGQPVPGDLTLFRSPGF
ncbi:MAG: hypothetical protein LBE38_05145 [Deltaproteobacteria bacterium]|jgi:hypothetical protein|nr:hypothetical protein [Deltaproteobacteria bacterium]